MKEPLAIHPVSSLLSQALLSDRKTCCLRTETLGSWAPPSARQMLPDADLFCPKGAGQWAPPAFSDSQSAHGPPLLLTDKGSQRCLHPNSWNREICHVTLKGAWCKGLADGKES